MGKDIIARAKNGTGKTGSFVIPILEKVNFTQKYVQALILVPTRELALQTSATIREIGKYLNVQCMITTGGTNLKDDIYRLYNPVQVLVGTPGRVFDLANKGYIFSVTKIGSRDKGGYSRCARSFGHPGGKLRPLCGHGGEYDRH